MRGRCACGARLSKTDFETSRFSTVRTVAALRALRANVEKAIGGLRGDENCAAMRTARR